MTSIYVIKSAKSVKIGIASDPKRRIRALKIGSPNKLSLVYEAAVTGNARILENQVHDYLEHNRLSGEWFKKAASGAISAISIVADRLGFALDQDTRIVAQPPQIVPLRDPRHSLCGPRVLKRLTVKTVDSL